MRLTWEKTVEVCFIILIFSSFIPLAAYSSDSSNPAAKNAPKENVIVRTFCVYSEETLVLKIEDRPGYLVSTALPPIEGLKKHPFLHGNAFDPASENELGSLLNKSSNFDEYLELLKSAGYNLRQCTNN